MTSKFNPVIPRGSDAVRRPYSVETRPWASLAEVRYRAFLGYTTYLTMASPVRHAVTMLASILLVRIGWWAAQSLISFVSGSLVTFEEAVMLVLHDVVEMTTTSRVVGALLVLVVFECLRKWWVVDDDPILEELTALINGNDPVVHCLLDELVKSQDSTTVVVNGIDRQRAVVKAALHAKAKFGLMTRTEANRMVIRRYVVEQMEAFGMRPTHIAAVADLATLMAFVPTDNEIFTAQASLCKEWCDRVDFMKHPTALGPAGTGLKFHHE